MSSTEISRRERKKDKTRERIAGAAFELFREKGFAHTTVDEIANRADVAKGTFFNYFPRKETVLGQLADEEMSRIEAEAGAILASPGACRAKILKGFARGVRSYEDQPELWRVIVLELVKGPGSPLVEVNARSHRVVRQFVEQGMETGELRSDLDPDRATAVLRGVFIATTLAWLHCPTVFDLGPEVRARLELVLDGLERGTARP